MTTTAGNLDRPSDPPPGMMPPATAGGAGPAPTSLKRRAITSSLWTMGGHALNQGLRFGSNLLLAWMLAPEMFGLMALVGAFMQALEMFSDLGIGPSIIHNKQGASPRYLNTAWTIAVIRGFVLWICAILIAYPVSLIWDDRLLTLLPVAGSAAAIAGFQSTAVSMLNRRLTLAPLVIMRVGQQVAAIIVMAVWAYYSPTVWALVAGNLISVTVKAIASHLLCRDIKTRFAWDRDAARELFRFGRWIFGSTLITFFAAQSDKLLFQPLVGSEVLGIYYMALVIATIVPMLCRQIASQVGFPALAELQRRDPQRFRSRLRHVRLMLVGMTEVGLLGVASAGPWLVNIIYPDRYQGMDAMIVPLAVGSMAGIVNTTYGTAYMAIGRTVFIMITVAAQFGLVLVCTLTGYHFGGALGFVIGMGLVQWLLYPLTAVLTIRLGIWDPKLDLPVLAFTGIIGFTLIWYG